MPSPTVEHILDSAVDTDLDRQLRELLSTCFTKPGDEVFRVQRYWRELPQHRWLIRNPNQVIAQVAIHDKVVCAKERSYRIGGVGDVCVHPEQRGRGYVKSLLATAHDWLRKQGFDFAVLFGEPHVYSSSGYATVENLFSDVPDAAGKLHRTKAEHMMVLPLGPQPWPATEVFLPGQVF